MMLLWWYQYWLVSALCTRPSNASPTTMVMTKIGVVKVMGTSWQFMCTHVQACQRTLSHHSVTGCCAGVETVHLFSLCKHVHRSPIAPLRYSTFATAEHVDELRLGS